MSDLRPLIRLTKFRLDEMRRVLMALHAQADRLRHTVVNLDAEVVNERDVARNDHEARMALGNYLKVARERRERLLDQIAEVEARIAIATDELAEVFMERKRYEIVHDARMEALRVERLRVENAALDEAGTIGFIRRSRGET